jgi:dihydrofolate reductase
MKRVRYSVAMSLDGYIAGPKGEADWIVMDPEIDFKALLAQFDTALMGRKTYEATKKPGRGGSLPGFTSYVFSRTLKQKDCPGVVVSDTALETVKELKQGTGKDIWLFGGAGLFKSLLEMGVVDSVEVAIVPVILGRGLPLLAECAACKRLRLTKHKIYSKTGTVALEYAVT